MGAGELPERPGQPWSSRLLAQAGHCLHAACTGAWPAARGLGASQDSSGSGFPLPRSPGERNLCVHLKELAPAVAPKVSLGH